MSVAVLPLIDDVAIERAIAGDGTVSLTKEELEIAWRQLEDKQLAAHEIAATLGVSRRSVVRWRMGGACITDAL